MFTRLDIRSFIRCFLLIIFTNLLRCSMVFILYFISLIILFSIPAFFAFYTIEKLLSVTVLNA